MKRNNMVWIIRSEYPTPIINEFVERLDGVIAGDGVRIIKSNRARTTLSVPFVNGQRVVVKRYHIRGWWEKIKYLFIPSRAKVEWEMMNTLLARGVAASVHLAYGKRRQWGFLIDENLIVKEIPNCLPFHAYIERYCLGTLSKDKILQKRALLKKLANFIRHIHDKNIDHRDFHGGNILVTEPDKGELIFHLIDLHKAWVCRRLSLRRKVDNLANICDTPRYLLSKTDCLRLIKHYLGHDNLSAASKERKKFKNFASKIFKRAARRQVRRFRSATKWCLKSSNIFNTFVSRNVRVYYRKGYDLENILKVVNKLRCSGGGKDHHILKRSSKSITILEKLSACGLEKQVVVKYNYCSGFFDMLKKTILGTRCRRAWIAGNGFIVRDISTPQPIALIEIKSFIFTKDNFLITEYLGKLSNINEYVLRWSNGGRGKNITPALTREMLKKKTLFIMKLAALIKSIHDNNIYHGDVSGKNILVKDGMDGGLDFFVVDLDSVSFCRRLSHRRRSVNLSQLNGCPNSITLTDRVRFLKEYYGKDFSSRKDAFWEIAELTQRRRGQKI